MIKTYDNILLLVYYILDLIGFKNNFLNIHQK